MNQNFYELSSEKQRKIINAGYKVFAMYPYKNAPMSAIAEEANISKSLLFYHFTNKKEYYLFLFSHAVSNAREESKKIYLDEESDFFVLMDLVINHRVQMMNQYPYMYKFLARAYYEPIDIVRQELFEIKSEIIQIGKEEALSKIDRQKFNHPEDADAFFDIVLRIADSYMYSNIDIAFTNTKKIVHDFQCLMESLKKNYYKEQYL